MIIIFKSSNCIENTCVIYISKFIPTHIYLPSYYSHLMPIPIFICKFCNEYSINIIFQCNSVLIIQPVNKILFNISTKQVQNIDQAHCSNQIWLMTDLKSQSFQHLLNNKPAKVDNNLISFQTVFTLDEKILSTKIFFLTLSPSTRMMFAHVY